MFYSEENGPGWGLIVPALILVFPLGVVLFFLRLRRSALWDARQTPAQRAAAREKNRQEAARRAVEQEAARREEVRQAAEREAARQVQACQTAEREAARQAEARRAAAQEAAFSAPRRKPPRRRHLLRWSGALLFICCGAGTFAALDDVGTFLTALFLCAVGAAMWLSGLFLDRSAALSSRCLDLIGARRSISLHQLAQALDMPQRRVRRIVRRMLRQGLLPAGYLDDASGRLILTDAGLPDEPEAEAEPAAETEDAQGDDFYRDTLRRIRTLNGAIADPGMSQKIDRIDAATEKIFAFLQRHPEKAPQLRSFFSYYLPTTLKILDAYAELAAQGAAGENAAQSKARVEDMMDGMVRAFEYQLDRLFTASALDLSAEADVLAQMLARDGLAQEGVLNAQQAGPPGPAQGETQPAPLTRRAGGA